MILAAAFRRRGSLRCLPCSLVRRQLRLLRRHRFLHLLHAGHVLDRVPDHVRRAPRVAEQRHVDPPRHHDPFGHQLLADRLAHRLHQLHEVGFLPGHDRVLVIERQGLPLGLLRNGGRGKRQQRREQTEREQRPPDHGTSWNRETTLVSPPDPRQRAAAVTSTAVVNAWIGPQVGPGTQGESYTATGVRFATRL